MNTIITKAGKTIDLKDIYKVESRIDEEVIIFAEVDDCSIIDSYFIGDSKGFDLVKNIPGECEYKEYKNGQLLYDRNCKNGKRHGNCKGWYEDGQLLYDHNYKDGNKHGNCKEWYDNGQLLIDWNYKDGNKHGNCKKWHSNGKLWYDYNYKDGKEVSQT